MFQHYALFGHLTIFENVAFGLRVRPRKQRPSEAAIAKKVHTLLELVQLDWLADRYPHQLSGGQRQRIALARALAVEPRVLLLDEPFGALDARVRQELRRWLRRLHDEVHVTSVFVTHDQEEALEVADRVVVMNHGRVEQIGTPEEVYDHPATPFVFEFLGPRQSPAVRRRRRRRSPARTSSRVTRAPRDRGIAGALRARHGDRPGRAPRVRARAFRADRQRRAAARALSRARAARGRRRLPHADAAQRLRAG